MNEVSKNNIENQRRDHLRSDSLDLDFEEELYAKERNDSMGNKRGDDSKGKKGGSERGRRNKEPKFDGDGNENGNGDKAVDGREERERRDEKVETSVGSITGNRQGLTLFTQSQSQSLSPSSLQHDQSPSLLNVKGDISAVVSTKSRDEVVRALSSLTSNVGNTIIATVPNSNKRTEGIETTNRLPSDPCFSAAASLSSSSSSSSSSSASSSSSCAAFSSPSPSPSLSLQGAGRERESDRDRDTDRDKGREDIQDGVGFHHSNNTSNRTPHSTATHASIMLLAVSQ